MLSMLPDEKIKCPYTGFEKQCREIVLSCKCPKFISIKQMDNGEMKDVHGCADGFMPMLVIEGARQTYSVGAAIESMRNEVVKQQEATLDMLALPYKQLQMNPTQVVYDPVSMKQIAIK